MADKDLTKLQVVDEKELFVWEDGKPTYFKQSNFVKCPFCGKCGNVNLGFTLTLFFNEPMFFIECSRCYARSSGFKTQEDAFRQWEQITVPEFGT